MKYFAFIRIFVCVSKGSIDDIKDGTSECTFLLRGLFLYYQDHDKKPSSKAWILATWFAFGCISLQKLALSIVIGWLHQYQSINGPRIINIRLHTKIVI